MTIHLSSSVASPLQSAHAQWRQQDAALTGTTTEEHSRTRGLRFIGLHLWREGHLEESAKFLITAVMWSPKDPLLLGELGSLLCALGRSSEAMGYLTASLELNPDQIQVWLTAGCLCSSLGEYDVAAQAFSAAIELDPASADACAGLGLVSFEAGRIDDAVTHLTQAVTRGMASLQVFGTLGHALQIKGDFTRASDMYRRASWACPTEARVRRKFAQARLIEVLLGGSAENALDVYDVVAGPDAEPRAVVVEHAADLLRTLGHAEASERLTAVVGRRN